ncbi:MAG: hypothetical protein RLZZ546_1349, partial [Bacteroidota bacterium]
MIDRYVIYMTKANFMQSIRLQVLFFLSILSSCTFFDSESLNPGFLILENPSLNTSSAEGDGVHQIKSIWVIVDGNVLGVFPLPAKVPVIPTGQKREILLRGGINLNADLSTSIEYPFYNSINIELDVKEGESYPVPLKFTYKADSKFDIVEGFEDSNHVFTKDLDNIQDTRIILSSEDKKSGQKSAS